MRPSRDEWAMSLALLTASRATCLRRSVGCVLLNARGHVLATGYNGVAAGLPHCNDMVGKPVFHDDPRVVDDGDWWVFDGERTTKFIPKWFNTPGNKQAVGHEKTYPHTCSGATSASGTNLDGCQAVHAEQNALLQCKDVYEIHTCYVTASPCMTCTKLLLNTGCQRIVFIDEYPHSEARQLWESSGRKWVQIKVEWSAPEHNSDTADEIGKVRLR